MVEAGVPANYSAVAPGKLLMQAPSVCDCACGADFLRGVEVYKKTCTVLDRGCGRQASESRVAWLWVLH